MATPIEWSRAFARQARADFDAWDMVRDAKLPECATLLFLQMACEKLAKAHLCLAGTPPADLRTSHAYTGRVLPVILREELQRGNAKKSLIRDLSRYVKRVAREIELLSPAVDDAGRRPDNVEYPWEDAAGKLLVPADYRFIAQQLLFERHGRTSLKLISMAIDRLLVT